MKKFLAIFLAFINIFIFTSLPSQAASMNAFIDAPSSVAKGKNFTVSVRFESEIDAYITATLSYDEDAVEYVSCSSSGINKVGNYINIVPSSSETSHKFDFVFKMKSTGTAAFTAKVTESYDIDLNSLGTPSAKKSIKGITPTVEPTKAPTAKPTATAKPTVKPTATPTAVSTSSPAPTDSITTSKPVVTPANSMEFLYNGELKYISEDFDEDKVNIPNGFEKKSLIFKNHNIFVATNKHELVMVYATDIVGKNGSFYIYNEGTNSFALYTEYLFGNNTYVFITPEKAPEYLTPATIDSEMLQNCPAYAFSSKQYSDFLALYGFIPGNTPSYYIYDKIENTLQRCPNIEIYNISKEEVSTMVPSATDSPMGENNLTPATPTAENSKQSSNSDKSDFLSKAFNFAKKNIIALSIAFAILLLIISIIIVVIGSRRKHEDINLDDYIFFDLDENGENNYNSDDNSTDDDYTKNESEFSEESRQNINKSPESYDISDEENDDLHI